MTDTCHSCATDIKDLYIKCHGFCNAVFHPQCCGLNSSVFDEVKKNKQIFWLCKSCSSLMSDIRLRRTVRSAYESGQENVLDKHNEIVEKLKSEILIDLRQEIRTNFATLINSNSRTPKSSKCAAAGIKSARRRIFEKTDAASRLPQQPLMCGTAESLSPSLGNIAASSSQTFWLYLSRISRDVKVEQVRKLATERLGTDNVEVVRLVANGRDISSLSFISFKIGLNADFKEKALSSATWPKGILFREFKDNRSIANFWNPNQTPNQTTPGNGAILNSQPNDDTMED